MADDKTLQEAVKQRLDDINNISVAIDTYDDMFSDFDPRDISQRELSEDFIIELLRRHRQSPRGKFDVVLVAPKTIEDAVAEKKIVSRLIRYFNAKYIQTVRSINRIRVRGVVYILFGTITLLALTLFTVYKQPERLTIELLGILFLPLGWFGVWEGFSKVIDIPFKLENEAEVFKRLSKASYKFDYIGEALKGSAQKFS